MLLRLQPSAEARSAYDDGTGRSRRALLFVTRHIATGWHAFVRAKPDSPARARAGRPLQPKLNFPPLAGGDGSARSATGLRLQPVSARASIARAVLPTVV